jgi:hypothetical protein
MCLVVDQNYSILKEDLVVYKFLCVDTHWGITSPYRHFIWELGKEYTTELDEYRPNIYRNDTFEVESGIHALMDFYQAVDVSNWFRKNRDYQARLFKCTIPAGSKVYVGTWNIYHGTASDKIIINRRVNIFDRIYQLFNRKVNKAKF